MSFTVEDGTGLAAANSYLATAAADVYWADRDNADWAAASTMAKEAALIAGTQLLDASYAWRGRKGSAGQALDWPRSGVVDGEGYAVSGASLPAALTAATAELALEALAERLLPGLERGGALKREMVKIDVIEEEREYFAGAPGSRSFPLVDRFLAGLIVGRVGGAGAKLRRA
jgi:hypothetical protein